MDVSRLLNLTGTLVAVADGDVDEYGDPTEVTTETTVRYWVDRSDAPRRQLRETVGVENWQTAVLDLYLPAGTPVTGVDRFRDCNGVVFEVLGPPHAHMHPVSGDVVYIGAQIKRVS